MGALRLLHPVHHSQPHPKLLLQTMQITTGAVNALIAGAWSLNEDVNAIDANGHEYFAGQVLAEDDADMRTRLRPDEYQPVLEVVRTEWLGWGGIIPVIKIYVTDNSGQELLMMISHRKKGNAKKFFKRWGAGNTSKLAPGSRFKILDCTTAMTEVNVHHKEEVPIVLVEAIRATPKPKLQSKLVNFLFKNENANK